ncbi:unnamed protein product, partial [Ectocarpus sp. 8 AP-2014]
HVSASRHHLFSRSQDDAKLTTSSLEAGSCCLVHIQTRSDLHPLTSPTPPYSHKHVHTKYYSSCTDMLNPERDKEEIRPRLTRETTNTAVAKATPAQHFVRRKKAT